MPIGMVGELLQDKTDKATDYESLYNRFCDYFESSALAVMDSVKKLSEKNVSFVDIIISSALRSHAEQIVAMGLLYGIAE